MNPYFDIIIRIASVYFFYVNRFKALSKLNIIADELHEAMREHGVEHFTEVKLAILEIDGNISIISGEKTLRQTRYKKLKRTIKTMM